MNKITLVIIIVFVIGGIVFVNSGQKKRSNQRVFLNRNGSFGIGVFEGRVGSNGRTYSISFSYVVRGETFKNGDTDCPLDSPKSAAAFADRKKAKRLDKFLVLYNEECPKESIIRLDYPIKDSTDFKRYVKEFERMRKQKANK